GHVVFLIRPRPTPLYPLSLHDALPILIAQAAITTIDPISGNSRSTPVRRRGPRNSPSAGWPWPPAGWPWPTTGWPVAGTAGPGRSEEHTSELQSRENLVCRLLLEKIKK